MSRWFEIFLPSLVGAAIAWGSVMLSPATPGKLKQARLAFCLAALGATAIAVWIAATTASWWGIVAGGGLSGATLGSATYAVWLGIDNEIKEAEKDGR
jgi:hypothetical protein